MGMRGKIAPVFFMERLRHTLKESSRYLLLGSLVYAPWAYGCTLPWTAALLDSLLAVVVLLWMAGCAVGRSAPTLPPVALSCALVLICLGLLMAWNAHFRYNPETYCFVLVHAPADHLPGAIDRSRALTATGHAAVLLGVFLCVCDTARGKLWRRRFLAVMGLSGASIMLLGLLQRASGASMIFWQPGPADGVFFGTFYYHGNAGAFINVVLPLCAAFGGRALYRAGAQGARALWIPAFLLCLGAAAVNVSRAGSLLSALLAAAIVVFELRAARGRLFSRLSAVAAVVAVCGALAALALSAGEAQAWEKWGQLKSQLKDEDNPRYLVNVVNWEMAQDAGTCGFGPGTFEMAFPHYTGPLGYALRGIWRYAHQDYLQAVIEWGWLGAALWMVLLFGGMARLLGNHPEPDARLRFACGLALGSLALHALVDFPFQIPSIQLYAAVLAGVGWARERAIFPRKDVRRNTGADLPGQFSIAFSSDRKESGEIAPSGLRGGRWRSKRRDCDPGAGPRNRH